MWGKGEACTPLMGMQISTTMTEHSMGAPQSIHMELPKDSAIPLLGICPKQVTSARGRDICTHVFNPALLTIAEIWNQPKHPSTNEWIKKIWLSTQWNTIQPSKRIQPRSGRVTHACSLSTYRGWGRRIAWAQELKAAGSHDGTTVLQPGDIGKQWL